MMWVNELTLIQEPTITYDDIGNPIESEPIETVIFCEVNSITRSEFYNASIAGLKPSIVFKIHSYEYNDEIKIKFDNKDYKVMRTYSNNTEEIELICEKVLGNG